MEYLLNLSILTKLDHSSIYVKLKSELNLIMESLCPTNKTLKIGPGMNKPERSKVRSIGNLDILKACKK